MELYFSNGECPSFCGLTSLNSRGSTDFKRLRGRTTSTLQWRHARFYLRPRRLIHVLLLGREPLSLEDWKHLQSSGLLKQNGYVISNGWWFVLPSDAHAAVRTCWECVLSVTGHSSCSFHCIPARSLIKHLPAFVSAGDSGSQLYRTGYSRLTELHGRF